MSFTFMQTAQFHTDPFTVSWLDEETRSDFNIQMRTSVLYFDGAEWYYERKMALFQSAWMSFERTVEAETSHSDMVWSTPVRTSELSSTRLKTYLLSKWPVSPLNQLAISSAPMGYDVLLYRTLQNPPNLTQTFISLIYRHTHTHVSVKGRKA